MWSTLIAGFVCAAIGSGAPTAVNSTMCRSGHSFQANGMIYCLPSADTKSHSDLATSYKCPHGWELEEYRGYVGCCQYVEGGVRCFVHHHVPTSSPGHKRDELKETAAMKSGLQRDGQAAHIDLSGPDGCPHGWDFLKAGVYGLCCSKTKKSGRCFVHGSKRAVPSELDHTEPQATPNETPGLSSTHRDTDMNATTDRCPLTLWINDKVFCCPRYINAFSDCHEIHNKLSGSTAVRRADIQEAVGTTPEVPAGQAVHMPLTERTVCPPTWELIEWPSELMCCPRAPFSADRCFKPQQRLTRSTGSEGSTLEGSDAMAPNLPKSTLGECALTGDVFVLHEVDYCCPREGKVSTRMCRIIRDNAAFSAEIKRAESEDTTATTLCDDLRFKCTTLFSPATLSPLDTTQSTSQDLNVARSAALAPDRQCPSNWQTFLQGTHTFCCPGAVRNVGLDAASMRKAFCCIGVEKKPGESGSQGCKGDVLLIDPDYDEKVNAAARKLGLRGRDVDLVEGGQAETGVVGGDGCAHEEVEEVELGRSR
ncbi:hypothetical protein DOTSEDRAFT_26332 [Dothistroma septosporum NZE10]|uniref:Uncharacterized protein n=1 Tax=Dothistroma septosporum (strain NZE10 / CBS 128990) TaxID=675120 RepID=N1PMQ8_DOTSN|nr:hypothetical protein DOTSEDRAFT_26332 [Dothistroma septosporum NZE10]